MRPATLLAILALVSSADATAQAPQLTPGRRVRVTSAAAGLDNTEAFVVGLRRDTMALQYATSRVDAHGQRHTDSLVTDVSTASVTSLAIYAGKKSGARTGLLIGGTSMLLIGVVGNAAYYSSGEEGYARYVIGGAVVTGAIGAGIGWLIGSAIKSDRWEEIPLDRVRVGIEPSREGLQVRASVRF